MYKVVVTVSGKRARLVPKGHHLATSDRELGEISQADALSNRNGLTGAIRNLLVDKGITDSELYSVEVPDALAADEVVKAAVVESDFKKATKAKGPVTKPVNPKEGEVGSDTNKPEVELEAAPVVQEEPKTALAAE